MAAAHTLVELLHSGDLEAGLLRFGCLNAEINRTKSSPLSGYLATRQSVPEQYVAADPMDAFYPTRLKDNGTLHHFFTDVSMADHEAFFRKTAAGYKKLADGLEMLERQIHLPYAIGDPVTIADLHILPWLSTLSRHLEHLIHVIFPSSRVVLYTINDTGLQAWAETSTVVD
ncbi:MAG: hypothetical protein Q9188_004011 [Gyalolechia gomerana]